MHDTALAIGQSFFGIYARKVRTIVDVGSLDINGSLRTVAPPQAMYVGVDLEPGPGVDIVVAAGRDLPLRDGSADVTVTSSAFEHDPQFWRTFSELCRITTPGGYIYVNAPSNGIVHRYPLDCWRFYPDAGMALAQLTKDEPWPVRLVESFVAERRSDTWNDFVAVFRRDGGEPQELPRLHERTDCRNVHDAARGQRLRVEDSTEDMRLLAGRAGDLASLKERLSLEVADRDRRIGELEPALRIAREEVDRLSQEIAARDGRIADLAGKVEAFQSSWQGRLHSLLRRTRR